jgi:CRISPR-associated endonuclease/helicase Cas3
MSRAKQRAERLRDMERFYVDRAYSDQEMADKLGVTRATVWKDRQLLSGSIAFISEGDGRYRIDRRSYISSVRLNLYEALTLYLAARRASRQTQMAEKHAVGALEKLAAALQQPMTERLVKAAHGVATGRRSVDGARILETLAEGWVERRVVRIEYRAFGAGETKIHRVRPYLIEPSQWSDSVYLIGHSDRAKRLTVLKTERIARAWSTTEQFEWPEDFDEEQLLRHAWGIWYTPEAPVEVRLRFTPGRVTQRVKESVWHPLETLTDTADGGCEWVCPVDEWHEMLPWIRSWGGDCEVLAPPDLRAELVAESARVAAMYA